MWSSSTWIFITQKNTPNSQISCPTLISRRPLLPFEWCHMIWTWPSSSSLGMPLKVSSQLGGDTYHLQDLAKVWVICLSHCIRASVRSVVCNLSAMSGLCECSALLWNRLMGTKVLATSSKNATYLRAYAHCTRNNTQVSNVYNNINHIPLHGC